MARLQTLESGVKCLLYCLPCFLYIVVNHLLDDIAGKYSRSGGIPWRLRGTRYVNHEVSCSGTAGFHAMAGAFPFSCERSKLRRLRCAAIGWICLQKRSKFIPDHFLLEYSQHRTPLQN